MTKEEAIKHAQAFEIELTALCKARGFTTYGLFGYLDSDILKAYPVLIHWVRSDIDVSSKHPQVVKAAFYSAYNVMRILTGQPLIHEEYHGFGPQKPPSP